MATSLLDMSNFGDFAAQQLDLEFKYDSHMASSFDFQDATQGWQPAGYTMSPGQHMTPQMYNGQQYPFPNQNFVGKHPDLAEQFQCQYPEVGSDHSSPSSTNPNLLTPPIFNGGVMQMSPPALMANHHWGQTQNVKVEQPHLELQEPTPLRRDSCYTDKLTANLDYTQIPVSSVPSQHGTPLLQSPVPERKARPTQRRRRSEYAEPGSERATYLEKNRQAASKCRNKQRRQQEELVEVARDAERKNKVLKAEVESLQTGMRELMDIMCQHTECADTRIRQYVQRGADRLASGGG